MTAVDNVNRRACITRSFIDLYLVRFIVLYVWLYLCCIIRDDGSHNPLNSRSLLGPYPLAE